MQCPVVHTVLGNGTIRIWLRSVRKNGFQLNIVQVPCVCGICKHIIPMRRLTSWRRSSPDLAKKCIAGTDEERPIATEFELEDGLVSHPSPTTLVASTVREAAEPSTSLSEKARGKQPVSSWWEHGLLAGGEDSCAVPGEDPEVLTAWLEKLEGEISFGIGLTNTNRIKGIDVASAAERAGLQMWDLITMVDEIAVGPGELVEAVAGRDAVQLTSAQSHGPTAPLLPDGLSEMPDAACDPCVQSSGRLRATLA